MTCIVGYVDKVDKKVVIGGDSAGTADSLTTIRSDEKVFINKQFVMGFTSSFRMGQLLRYCFSPPKQTKKQTEYEYMCTSFVDSVRQCLKDGGCAKTKDDEEEGGTFLVGYKGVLYLIDSDYQVGINSSGYAAVGSGDEVAYGALYALIDSGKAKKMTSEEVVRVALEASAKFINSVEPPFNIVKY